MDRITYISANVLWFILFITLAVLYLTCYKKIDRIVVLTMQLILIGLTIILHISCLE